MEFNPEVISYNALLQVFFALHDPFSAVSQGPDSGPAYRSAIFTSTTQQHGQAQQALDGLAGLHGGASPATLLRPLDTFYPAEQVHQDYYMENAAKPYCRTYIAPKIVQVQQRFADLFDGQM